MKPKSKSKGRSGKPAGKPKDHRKIKNKVGVRTAARNETSAQSVSSKRIVLPVQSLGPSSDVISDSLIGLRHFNNRKRIDAINALNRLAPIDFGRDKLVSVLVCASYAMSDDDALVRLKCGQLIQRLLGDAAINCIGSIAHGVGLHIRSSLSNVNAAVRRDSMLLLEKLLNLPEVFDEGELNDLLVTLLQLGTTIVSNQQFTSEEDRSMVKRVLMSILEKLLAIRMRLEQGSVRSSQWCISSLLAVNPSCSSLSVDMSRYLAGLKHSGDNAELETILLLARRLEIPVNLALLVDPVKTVAKKPKSTGGVFSKMARLLRGNSDSD